jgi:hypothetical protein
MPTAEIAGVVELGQWTPVPGGFEILVEPTSKIRRFHVRVRPKPPKTGKVRHRRHIRRHLTDEADGVD